MGFKFNPFTGMLDVVDDSGGAAAVIDTTLFKRALTVKSESSYSIDANSKTRIISYDGFTNNRIRGSVTVNVDGSVSVGSFAAIAVGA
jgi:hypothetical protein